LVPPVTRALLQGGVGIFGAARAVARPTPSTADNGKHCRRFSLVPSLRRADCPTAGSSYEANTVR